jgi:hypothetical protein
VIASLKQEGPGDFPVEMQFQKGFSHGGLPDRDKIREMYPFTRNPNPRHLTWEMTDPVIKAFFWLEVQQPGPGQSIDAVLHDNLVRLTTQKVKQFQMGVDRRLVTYGKPLQIVMNGTARNVDLKPQFSVMCQSMFERGDPELAFTCRISLLGDGK